MSTEQGHASEHEPDNETPGYDRVAVERWLAENIDALAGPFGWERLEGGHSNLTFRLTGSDGGRGVIRRPPLGELLPKAHDMKREFTVISGLGGTEVPVATALGICEDTSVTGAIFYVMSEVSGRAMYTAEDVDEWLDMKARKNVGTALIETLAALHQLEPDEVGLDQLARHDGYVARQLRTWYGSWRVSSEAAEYDDPRIHSLHDQLLERIPDQGPARLVHGDYGLHNCMVNSDGTMAAVLDWEIATLGDPMADFAYALNGWSDPDDTIRVSHEAATTAPGFQRRNELAELYASITGRSLAELDYYRAFNYFKTACILHGVYARYKLGKKSSDGIDLEAMKERMIGSIELAEAQAG